MRAGSSALPRPIAGHARRPSLYKLETKSQLDAFRSTGKPVSVIRHLYLWPQNGKSFSSQYKYVNHVCTAESTIRLGEGSRCDSAGGISWLAARAHQTFVETERGHHSWPPRRRV